MELARSKPPAPLRPLSTQCPLHGAVPPLPLTHPYLDLIPLTLPSPPPQHLSVPSRPSDQDKGRARGSDLQGGRQNWQHQYLCVGRRGQPDPAWRHYSAHQRVSPGYSWLSKASKSRGLELTVPVTLLSTLSPTFRAPTGTLQYSKVV